MFPLKWESDRFDGWYLEKHNNSNTWYFYFENKFSEKYTQVSIKLGLDGYPIVFLMRNSDFLIFKITEGRVWSGWSFSELTIDETIGYWTVKKSNKY